MKTLHELIVERLAKLDDLLEEIGDGEYSDQCKILNEALLNLTKEQKSIHYDGLPVVSNRGD